nr:hypothetical protein [Actinomycetota bacterium]
DPSQDQHLEISASAIADALRTDAETIAAVNRARARMVGTTATLRGSRSRPAPLTWEIGGPGW